MSNFDDFDPFGLSTDDKKETSRPVLIAVSDGDVGPPQPNGQGPIHADDSFDPFEIGKEESEKKPPPGAEEDDRSTSPEPPPQVSRVTRSTLSTTSSKGVLLPPKLLVKIIVHEEVASMSKEGLEGKSEVTVEGTIYAQVQCSDARKNAPFALTIMDPPDNLTVRPNKEFSQPWGNLRQLVEIPKKEIAHVPVAYYSMSDHIDHMPILLERKVTINGNSCRIALQVRSKLTNLADLEDFSIAVAVPEVVDGASIEVLRGEGEWDDLRRLITWRLASLNKGHSFMVSAQAKLLKEESDIQFPVILRCSSPADQISAVDVQVGEAHGHPTSTSCQKSYTFRLLHRLT